MVQSPQRGQVHLPPPPQHPHRSRKMLMQPCLLLPLRSALHPNADAPSPLLHNAHNLTPLLARSRHQGADQKVVVEAHQFHQDQVESGSGSGSRDGSPARSEASTGVRSACSQTALIGSVKVLSGDKTSGDDDDDDALYSAN